MLVWRAGRQARAGAGAVREYAVRTSQAESAVSLYRRALRAVNAFPLKYVRYKIKYNIRECYALHAEVCDPKMLDQLIAEGSHDVHVLERLGKFDNATLSLLVRKSSDKVPKAPAED